MDHEIRVPNEIIYQKWSSRGVLEAGAMTSPSWVPTSW